MSKLPTVVPGQIGLAQRGLYVIVVDDTDEVPVLIVNRSFTIKTINQDCRSSRLEIFLSDDFKLLYSEATKWVLCADHEGKQQFPFEAQVFLTS